MNMQNYVENRWSSLFLFFNINIFVGYIWSKYSKLFKAKFDTKTISNMKYSMVVSILSVKTDWQKLPFVGKFAPKNRNRQFKLKIGT